MCFLSLNLSLELVLRKSGNHLVKKLLGAHPDRRALAVLQGHQAGQKCIAECLGRLSRQKRGKVVNGDD